MKKEYVVNNHGVAFVKPTKHKELKMKNHTLNVELTPLAVAGKVILEVEVITENTAKLIPVEIYLDNLCIGDTEFIKDMLSRHFLDQPLSEIFRILGQS